MKSLPALACLLLSLLTASAAEFDLGPRGVLSATLPEGWVADAQPAGRPGGKTLGYTVAFKPPGEANAKGLLTLIFLPNRPLDKATLHAETLRTADRFVAGSVEQKKTLKEFVLKEGFGAYCVFTDAGLVGKPSKRGDYKVLVSGQVQPAADTLGVVSLFADEAEGKEFKAMIQIINSLQLKPKDAK